MNIDDLLGHLGADRGDVSVIEHVKHEPLDQARLSDTRVADKANLDFHQVFVSHELCPPFRRFES
jgi:hypothetical protein